jgi:AGZA family xanthine/uracil permease-like MFS transporter
MAASLFQLKEKQTNVRTEAVAGATTFLTMSYIIFTHPNILSPTGMDKNALIAVTCIVSGLVTILTGLFANAPIAMAPGLGLNSIFVYLVVSGEMDWQHALGVVFISGLLFLILTLLGLRKKIVEAIPVSLISAIAVGIGLFITFIGLQDMGIIVKDEITLVKAGPINLMVLIGLLGLLVMIFLEIMKIKGALLIGIIVATIVSVISKQTTLPEQVISMDIDISPIALKLDILGALKWSFFGGIFTLMFVDMFDSLGTLAACCHQAKMVDDKGNIKGLDRLLSLDAIATMIGALFGTSTTTSYIESASGIEQGGRTGLTSIITGLLFLIAVLFIPVVRIVPKFATAPALIMVGLFMMKEVKNIDFTKLDEAFPAFIIMVMIALSYSISTGLAFGFVSFVVIKVVCGKIRDVKLTMWLIAVISAAFLIKDRLIELIGA